MRTILILTLALITASVALATKSTINPDGVLEIDGKKIFVIGFTAAPPADGKTPTGKDAFAELADAGATFVRFGPEQAWSDARLSKNKNSKTLRRAKDCTAGSIFAKPPASSPATLTTKNCCAKYLLALRTIPALGAYKGADEPEWGKHPLLPLERAYQIVKELDPNHPLVIIQAPRGTIESLKRYNPVSDITGLDIYPIGYAPGLHSQFSKTNSEMSMVGDYTRWMTEVAERKKPVWMTLQISWSGVLNEGKTLRFPTFPEERFMTYQAIINGARGLTYFGGGLPKGLNDEDRKLGWNWHFWNRVLRPVIEEIGAKSQLYPALLASESKLPVTVKGDGIEFCVREVGGDIFLLACKREGATAKAEFSGLPETSATANVLFEEPRSVELKSGKLTDWFAPFEVHVYRFKSGN